MLYSRSLLVIYIQLYIYVNLIVSLISFLGPHLWPRDIPRLGVEVELQLPAYTTATAMPTPSHVCDLHHSSWQCWILNPLSGAWDQTHILMDLGRVHYHWATTGSPYPITTTKNPSDARNESNANRGKKKKKKKSLSNYFSSKTCQLVCIFWTHFWFKCEHSKGKRNTRITYIKIFLANININIWTYISCF